MNWPTLDEIATQLARDEDRHYFMAHKSICKATGDGVEFSRIERAVIVRRRNLRR